MKKFDFLIVGAGFYGVTFARTVAEKNKTCLIIDKNEHIAGAAYDKYVNNILVCQYGAHIFHTKDKKIWEFVNQFAEFNSYINKPKVIVGGEMYSFPLNMMTFYQMWGTKTPEEARKKIINERLDIPNPKNAEEWILSQVGRDIYEKFFYHYTKKQWFKEPKDLPTSIVKRLPIRLTWEENYFSTDYQGMPIDGYTKLAERIADHKNISIELNFHFDTKWEDVANRIVYCGQVDKLFKYKFGKLDYNSLRFEHRSFTGDYQGCAVVNYSGPDTEYLRSVEHKHFYDLSHLKKHVDIDHVDTSETIVTFDYPIKFEDHPEPYYPIRDNKNSDIFAKYASLAKKSNIILGGRIGQYQYLDMDQTMASAVKKANSIIN